MQSEWFNPWETDETLRASQRWLLDQIQDCSFFHLMHRYMQLFIERERRVCNGRENLAPGDTERSLCFKEEVWCALRKNLYVNVYKVFAILRHMCPCGYSWVKSDPDSGMRARRVPDLGSAWLCFVLVKLQEMHFWRGVMICITEKFVVSF